MFEREAIVLGNIQIRYYGIIIVAAILIATLVATRLARRDGRDPDHIWGAMFGAVILGIIGARLWYVLFPPEAAVARGNDTAWYLANFFNLNGGAIAIWTGGLSIFGAFVGGFIGAYIYIARNKLPLLPWLDIAAVALPLGQFIGRWANYVNQELYGIPTGSEWFGIAIQTGKRLDPYRSTIEYPTTTLFHPLFLYEGLWSLLAFFVLLTVFQRYRKQLRPGVIFLLYVAQYAFIRFMLEFLRVEITTLGGVNLAQAVCAVAFVLSAGTLLAWLNRPYSAPAPVAGRPA
jgi:phosphatidylglycerol:prolipoprotein diacylglycerol transferase